MAESILCEEGMYLWEMTLIGMLEVSAFFHDENRTMCKYVLCSPGHGGYGNSLSPFSIRNDAQ